MQKRIIIGIAGAEGKEFKDVAILPNTRAIDVLNRLNLRGFQLAKPAERPFAPQKTALLPDEFVWCLDSAPCK